MEVRGMAKRYQHRIGVRAEICFNIVLDTRNPSPDQLAQAVTEILIGAEGADGGFKLTVLPEGSAYPDWNSVDPELEPGHILDPSAIRTLDCVEIDSVQ
jgi:hypothetical protein